MYFPSYLLQFQNLGRYEEGPCVLCGMCVCVCVWGGGGGGWGADIAGIIYQMPLNILLMI